MVLGLGCDIVEIERVAGVFTSDRKLARIFTDSEIELARTDSSLAGRFAAKEAFLKALGTGKQGVQLKEIEVLRDISGKPYINGERLKQVLDPGIRKTCKDKRDHISQQEGRNVSSNYRR